MSLCPPTSSAGHELPSAFLGSVQKAVWGTVREYLSSVVTNTSLSGVMGSLHQICVTLTPVRLGQVA